MVPSKITTQSFVKSHPFFPMPSTYPPPIYLLYLPDLFGKRQVKIIEKGLKYLAERWKARS